MFDKAIVVGSGILAVRIAEYLLNHMDTAVYEYRLSDYSSVKFMCMKKNIPYRTLERREMGTRISDEAKNKKILIVSAVNTYIFPKFIVGSPNIRIINYHNSLLPRHRGMNAEAWSIFAMERETGITWHFVDEDIDTGKIIIQRRIPLSNSVTSLKLLKMQSEEAYKAFISFSGKLLSGDMEGRIQQKNISSEIHGIHEIPCGGIINPAWSIEKTFAFLRALDYGKIETLGRPKFEAGGKLYDCEGYRLTDNSCKSPCDSFNIEGSTCEICKKGSSKKILLLRCRA